MNLRKFLVVGSLFLSLFLIVTLYFSIKLVASSVYNDVSLQRAWQTADRTYASLYQVMRRGWTRAETEQFLANMNRSSSEVESVTVYQGPLVMEQYGPIEQPPITSEAAAVFREGSKRHVRDGDFLRFYYPIIAADECMLCHVNVRPGEVLGVIAVRSNLGHSSAEFSRLMLRTIIPIAIFPVLGAVILGLILHRRIFASIRRFQADVGGLTKVADLSKVELTPGGYPLEEFNILKQETNSLISKLKKIAIDKETLEFEIQLLEKLLITSEVVRDWRDHVKSLLVEINKVMDIPFIFAMFYVEDKVYELEVFWLRAPSPVLKRHFEKTITATIRNDFPDLANCSVEHLVAVSLGKLDGLKEEEIDLHTKKIFLDAPKIGGIVGIGLMTRDALDHTKLLVIEGILTTLLNVIGSVKAIYKYTQQVEYYATRDPQTGLYNQRFFRDLLEQEIARARRNDGVFSVLLIDLDNFKNINDRYGHGFGDSFLLAVAATIRQRERAGDIVARFGGDEFILLMPETGQEHGVGVAERLAEAIRAEQLAAPDGAMAGASATLSLVTFPEHGATITDLLLMAEKIMAKAKDAGKNHLLLPGGDDLLELFRGKSEMAMILKRALDENKIIPYFQPIYDYRRRRIGGHEVLMRIRGANGELIAAQDFIEVAEEMGMINRMDIVLIEKVFERIRLENYQDLIFLNISPRDLVHAEFMAAINRLVEAYGIDPGNIVFEITEREAIRNLNLVEKFVLDLKMKGFRFALDDFGSGFSSYFYIKKFPIDYIKIEGDFVRGMMDNEVDMAVVESIVVLARRIGVKVVSEFVESEEVFRETASLGVDFGQGFFICHPSPTLVHRLPDLPDRP